MINRFAEFLQRLFRIPMTRTRHTLQLAGAALAVGVFVSIVTMLVAFDSVFLGANNIAGLRVGDIAPQDIRAPAAVPSSISPVLTEQQRQRVRSTVAEVYYLPDPSVSRRQVELARLILNYITNIRRDPFGTLDQKLNDLSYITDLTLSGDIARQILTLDEQSWNDINEQVSSILERVMQGEIREANLPSIRAQLPTQVSVRFNDTVSRIIVAIVEDLVRPNTLLNPDATALARDEAAAQVEVRRSFERGQLVVRAGERIDEATYEALAMLGLLQPADRRLHEVFRALLSSVLMIVVTGLYISRFTPWLMHSPRILSLLAVIFLIVLFGARMSGIYGQIYLYPTATLAIIFVAVAGAEIAVIGSFGLAMLVGMMQNNSLELALMVAAGGMMAALTLRSAERLNSFFLPGILVSLSNVVVVTIFSQGGATLNAEANLSELLVYGMINGILAATAALGGLYLITLVFNLPTGIRLIELSQPNQPLLQRLLREAPGTYQHSLQVANLAEQAANAIGANANLVRVAALYHDIGKMINAPFFTENQVEGMNPHDVLDDPARSADIIISHVTDGEKMARQNRLPARLRDFILEHHGTQVLYFYQQAVERAGDNEAIDVEQFTYPGPKPQSRETAVLMIADSCEAAVRSRKPIKKQDITDTVQQIIEIKIRTGQLDESNLTLNDIYTIRKIITDMLQAVFHPRISYPQPVGERDEDRPRTETPTPRTEMNRVPPAEPRTETPTPPTVNVEAARPKLQTREVAPVTASPDEDEDSPLPEVPPLPRTTEQRQVQLNDNGQHPVEEDITEDQPD